MTIAGSAIPVVTSTDAPLAGPALRVAVVSDRLVQAGPAFRLVEVTDGRATQGNPPIPVSVVTDGRATVAGPPIPVVVMSGSLNPNSPLLNGLVSYWKLDEVSGTRNDSYSTNHLTDNNTVTSSAGKIGLAATFTAATSEYLSVADNASLDLTTKMTLAGWIRLTTTTANMCVAAKFEFNVSGSWAVQVTSVGTGIRTFIALNASDTNGSNAADTANGLLSTNTWYHITIVFDGAGATNADRLKCYIDGTAQTLSFIGSIATVLNNSTAALEFGRFQGLGRHWNGNLDEFGLWGRALSAAEITQLYNGGNGRTYPFT